jgi:hypothetical protein
VKSHERFKRFLLSKDLGGKIVTTVRVESNPLDSLLPENSNYPLQIQSIPESERISPEFNCRLIHQATGLQVPGQFTAEEATLIQKVTQNWDWRIEKDNKPACAAQLLQFLEQLCAPSPGDKGGGV